MTRLREIQGNKGFTLIELLTVITIIGILATVAIPQYSAYKDRAYRSDAKGNLHNIYLACKAYWTNNTGTNPCTTALASGSTYGWVKSTDVSVAISNGTESGFSATSTHSSDTGSVTYTMNASGNIS